MPVSRQNFVNYSKLRFKYPSLGFQGYYKKYSKRFRIFSVLSVLTKRVQLTHSLKDLMPIILTSSFKQSVHIGIARNFTKINKKRTCKLLADCKSNSLISQIKILLAVLMGSY